MLAGKMLPPRGHGGLIPSPQAHALKPGFEKYYSYKTGTGTCSSHNNDRP